DNRANTSAPSDTLISRFSMIDDTLTYLDSMLPSSGLGHQSLAIDDQGYLWSRGVDASTGVVRFKYTANTAPTVQRFLISDRIVDVNISSDGRWLIGRGGYDHG